ncbi:hypothetical protein KA005_43990, partial [bacterium]|nr:hypothetical protein [bacterium]
MEYSEALKKFNYENIYDSMPAYDDPCWLWNAEEYQVDEGGYKPFITAFFEELKSYLPFYDNLQKLKNTITNKKLNIYHMEHMRTFLEYRTSVLEELVLKHVELFDAVKAFARKNILFDTLVDGYSIDVNRNDPKKSKILPLLPFRHQLEYIHEMEYGNKGIICTKGRRQGASVFATNDQRRGLIHRDNQAMAIANKSKLDTDRGKNDTMGNSSMSRLDLMMKHSIF